LHRKQGPKANATKCRRFRLDGARRWADPCSICRVTEAAMSALAVGQARVRPRGKGTVGGALPMVEQKRRSTGNDDGGKERRQEDTHRRASAQGRATSGTSRPRPASPRRGRPRQSPWRDKSLLRWSYCISPHHVPRSWRRPTPDTLIYVNRSSISGHPLGRGRACA